jgi:hypothetical protein
VDRIKGAEVIGALLGDLWPYIIAALGTLATIATAWLVGRKAGADGVKTKRAAQDAKAQAETVERVLHETASDDPADAIRQRLRDRARKP